jgi:hypothetical protein
MANLSQSSAISTRPEPLQAAPSSPTLRFVGQREKGVFVPPDRCQRELLLPKIRTIFATSHKKLLSGLPTLQSIHCRRGGRQVIFISSGDFQPTWRILGAFDVEIRDPRCRFSGLRGHSGRSRPPTASASAGCRAGRQISLGQISRRQEPNWQIPGRVTGSDQRLI